MKMTLILMLLAISTASFSSDGGAKAEMSKKRFEKRKAKAVAMADKRIAALTELKSCVSKATDKSSLKGCQEAHKKKNMAALKERKAYREKMKAEKMKRKSKKE